MNYFEPHPPLIAGTCHPSCRASVIIPARNEERSLTATLDALRMQKTEDGASLDADLYEIILLLNNCTDASVSVARQYQARYPSLHLHIAEINLAPEIAHVGTARRLLMDTAWHRLRLQTASAILSTDADTVVSQKWVTRNLKTIEAGAEVVGGIIRVDAREMQRLDPGTLEAFRRDRNYQRRVARLENLLDPDPSDPWPRHLEHFGASLACTPAVYARSGGMPPIKPLEDVAFIDACRRVDARIRHAPDISITTSARLDGRAEVGLSGQLRHWQQDSAANRPHMVLSATYLSHRFLSLARLRSIRTMQHLPAPDTLPTCWREPLNEVHPRRLGPSSFLCAIDSDRLIEETFRGPREDLIHRAIPALSRAIARASTPAPELQAETSPAAWIEPFATPAG